MATLTLNADTVETLFDQNDDENGFQLTTTAVPGQRLYRISRERTSLTTALDYFEFYLNLSDIAAGTLVIKDIPYLPNLFSASPTPKQLSELPTDSPGTQFSGERFKLLFMTPTVNGDPIREIPSYINLKATYTMSGAPRPIRFIYYTLIDGKPVYTGYLGNIAFSDQYDQNIDLATRIDRTKRVNIITDNGIDYYVIHVSTTPGMIITKETTNTSMLTETYTINSVIYTLRASSGGTQSWMSSQGVKQNGFYLFVTVTDILGHPLIEYDHDMRFIVLPQNSIDSFTVTRMSSTEFQFVIRPKVGVADMDLRVVLDFAR